jgi:hypothetical protein
VKVLAEVMKKLAGIEIASLECFFTRVSLAVLSTPVPFRIFKQTRRLN